MIKQQTFKFNFSKKNEDEFNYFINKTNEDAYNALLKKNYTNLFLYGPKKSGKTLLGKIWSNLNNAVEFNDNFEFLINNRNNIFIDNFEKFNEEEIFHIINYCNSNKLKILITSNLEINNINYLIKDLSSRLKTFDYYVINKPNDEILLNILTKLLIEKQFIINSHEIFDYILRRIKRSYEDIYDLVEKLDNISLEKKRQLTIPLIKEIL